MKLWQLLTVPGRPRLFLATSTCLVLALLSWIGLTHSMGLLEASAYKVESMHPRVAAVPGVLASMEDGNRDIEQTVGSMRWVRLATVVAFGLIILYEAVAFIRWQRSQSHPTAVKAA